jgi:SAM-dependent methyltransferase
MQDTTRALIGYYVDQLNVSEPVLEIGGHRLTQDAINLFPEPHTIVADITDHRNTIPDESFNLVFSSDVFGRIDRPWLAAAEISRILKPGGLAITHSRFGWGDDVSTLDYWRFTPEGLEFLFADLECLEKGYDVSDEHWMVYSVSRKGSGPTVTRFQDSSHPLAVNLRQDIRGVPQATLSPTGPPPDPVEPLRPVLAEMTDRLAGLEKLVEDRIAQLDAIDTRSRRLERRIDRAVAAFPFRTILRVRRSLYRMLK